MRPAKRARSPDAADTLTVSVCVYALADKHGLPELKALAAQRLGGCGCHHPPGKPPCAAWDTAAAALWKCAVEAYARRTMRDVVVAILCGLPGVACQMDVADVVWITRGWHLTCKCWVGVACSQRGIWRLLRLVISALWKGDG